MSFKICLRPFIAVLAALAALGALLSVAALATANSALAAEGQANGMAATLGRGVNVLGYDPIWKDPAKARFKPRYYKMLHDSGFQTIRVNLHAFAFMNDAGKLDRPWLETLDTVIDRATAAGLNVILDEHDYRFCQNDVAGCRTRLLAFWDEIGTRYRDRPKSVFFEILNEPHGALTPELWNGLLSEALAVVARPIPRAA